MEAARLVTDRDNSALVTDLVEWVAKAPRTYAEVMDAWRTSCPRLPIWEEAVDRRLVAREYSPERGATVAVTLGGWELLRSCGREPNRNEMERTDDARSDDQWGST
jgi:hypothetical protein